jgi:hypothetical protein
MYMLRRCIYVIVSISYSPSWSNSDVVAFFSSLDSLISSLVMFIHSMILVL